MKNISSTVEARKKCKTCGKWIVANREQKENLEKKILDHVCFEERCSSCYKMLPNAAALKEHCCQLTVPPYPKQFPSLGVLDIEAAQINGAHYDMLLVLSYERAFSGVF